MVRKKWYRLVLPLLLAFGLMCSGFCAAYESVGRDGASLYAWRLFLLNDGAYPQLRRLLLAFEIDRVYQAIPEEYLTDGQTVDMVENLAGDGIETVAILGEKVWGLKGNDLSDFKRYVDGLRAYNEGIGQDHPIKKIALDVETYTEPAWHSHPAAYFSDYVAQMERICLYAHENDIQVVQVIPVHFDQIDAGLFERLLTNCCDEISIMNYERDTQVAAISGELEKCREAGIPVETIFETSKPNSDHEVTERLTYFYSGFSELEETAAKIRREYHYDKLGVAYHHLNPMYHMATGKYFAEIYAYTNQADPTRNELGQTDALRSLRLTGDDGSCVTAYLYHPNLGAAYEENVFLAVGVRPDTTYTVSATGEDYRVGSDNRLTFTYEGRSMTDYASLKIERLKGR